MTWMDITDILMERDALLAETAHLRAERDALQTLLVRALDHDLGWVPDARAFLDKQA